MVKRSCKFNAILPHFLLELLLKKYKLIRQLVNPCSLCRNKLKLFLILLTFLGQSLTERHADKMHTSNFRYFFQLWFFNVKIGFCVIVCIFISQKLSGPNDLNKTYDQNKFCKIFYIFLVYKLVLILFSSASQTKERILFRSNKKPILCI